MKNLVLAFSVLLTSSLAFAQKTKQCQPIIKDMKTSIVGEHILINLNVHSPCNFMNYPRVIAFLGDTQLNEPEMIYYGHTANSEQHYTVKVLAKYKNQIDQLHFKMMGARDGKLKDMIKESNASQPSSVSNLAQITHIKKILAKKDLQLELDVYSRQKIDENVFVAVYHNGKMLGKSIELAKSHSAAKMVKYRVIVPEEFQYKLHELSFQLIGTNSMANLEVVLD